MEPRIQYAQTEDGGRIAFATLGTGRPLVCLPPWPVDVELTWEISEARDLLESLALRNRLVIPTRRGVAGSQGSIEGLSLETQLTDLDAVVKHVDADGFDMFGCLDGAGICAAYLASRSVPESKLVLWAPYARGVGSDRPQVQSLLNLVSEHWTLARKAMADVVFPSGPIESRDWFAGCYRRSMTKEVAAVYLSFQSDLDVQDYLPKLSVPTLVLYRRGDRNLPPKIVKAAAALIPGARVVPLDGDISHPFFGDTSYGETIRRFLHDEPDAISTPHVADMYTILFTDMASSTTLTQQLGDAAAQEVRRAHNDIVRGALSANAGSEIKHTGDGIMASFSTASAALECAIAIQRGVAAHREEHPDSPLSVYVGLNAGEPIAEDDDLFGTAVITAARMSAKAEGGEILTSDTVRGLVAGKDFLFSDRGDVALRGFEEPVRLYEVSWQEQA